MGYVKKAFTRMASLLLILVIALCGFLMVGKINGGKTQLFGNEILVVLSGSMKPAFDTGSIVAIKPVPFSEIQIGDIVTFEDLDKRTITHRVIDIVDGKLITKGDANDGQDTDPVTPDRVRGKVQFTVPYIGYLINFVKSPTGMFLFLAGPGVYLIVSQVWKLLRMLKEQEQASKSQVE